MILTPANVTTVGTKNDALRDFFGLPFCPLLPSSPGFDLRQKHVRRFFGCAGPRHGLLRRLRLIVVSRVSVMHTSVVSTMSHVLHICSHGLHRPFNNGRVLLINSIFRLRPIIGKSRQRVLGQFCPAPCFFSTEMFNRVSLISVRLRGMCQRASDGFVRILSRVHGGAINSARLRLLGAHCNARVRRSRTSVCVALTAHHSGISCVGSGGLTRLPNSPIAFCNRVVKSFPRDDLPASRRLMLGPNTRVVFVGGSFSHH